MAEAIRVDVGDDEIGFYGVEKAITLAKPPWSEIPHTGKLERLILNLGAGKGRFDEVYGIPRSIGCIGNNHFIMRREKMSEAEIRKVLADFRRLGGEEVWITNYDEPEELVRAARLAKEMGVKEVHTTVLLEDVDSVGPIDGVKIIVETEYEPDKVIKAASIPWISGILVTVDQEKMKEVEELLSKLDGDGELELYLDVLYAPSIRETTVNLFELRRSRNPTNKNYHDCLAGTVAVTGDGYILPCPLMRNYIIGDARKGGLKYITRKKKLKELWKLTKDKIDACSTCPFKYMCHDPRAVEYQVTGQVEGVEYCPLLT
ncbi:SPASM domain-containing protein [Thermococcus sp. Bubb.Bath]|uniref:SPASM domain-containing protein n=1 Tax=Thermococcus sp. Bubb.Bath TaxID=1638242 RepID=UPI00143B1C7C|nr:SPASM domain-containing protein [Thermococcus sp. Bubb.Bath]NJF25859.1 SPASM domain-containing protein [Thermococcus sp. Bubb.Bath]